MSEKTAKKTKLPRRNAASTKLDSFGPTGKHKHRPGFQRTVGNYGRYGPGSTNSITELDTRGLQHGNELFRFPLPTTGTGPAGRNGRQIRVKQLSVQMVIDKDNPNKLIVQPDSIPNIFRCVTSIDHQAHNLGGTAELVPNGILGFPRPDIGNRYTYERDDIVPKQYSSGPRDTAAIPHNKQLPTPVYYEAVVDVDVLVTFEGDNGVAADKAFWFNVYPLGITNAWKNERNFQLRLKTVYLDI